MDFRRRLVSVYYPHVYDLSITTPAAIRTGDIILCPYTKSIKSIKLPKGEYKLECWGAGDGEASGKENPNTGIGGYSVGQLKLNQSRILYLCCGGLGIYKGYDEGGYNGGGIAGDDGSGVSGSGATHIGLKSGLLTAFESDYISQLIMAAGGGGGRQGYYGYKGGNGGGISGGNGEGGKSNAGGGTQTSGGTGGKGYNANGDPGTFGQGGNATHSGGYSDGGGGGGGFYGGGGGGNGALLARSNSGAGGGGSGFVNTNFLTNASTSTPTSVTNPDPNYNGYIKITVYKAFGESYKQGTDPGDIGEFGGVIVKVNSTLYEAVLYNDTRNKYEWGAYETLVGCSTDTTAYNGELNTSIAMANDACFIDQYGNNNTIWSELQNYRTSTGLNTWFVPSRAELETIRTGGSDVKGSDTTIETWFSLTPSATQQGIHSSTEYDSPNSVCFATDFKIWSNSKKSVKRGVVFFRQIG